MNKKPHAGRCSFRVDQTQAGYCPYLYLVIIATFLGHPHYQSIMAMLSASFYHHSQRTLIHPSMIKARILPTCVPTPEVAANPHYLKSRPGALFQASIKSQVHFRHTQQTHIHKHKPRLSKPGHQHLHRLDTTCPRELESPSRSGRTRPPEPELTRSYPTST